MIPSSLDRVRASSVQSYTDAAEASAGQHTPEPYPEVSHHAFMHGVASGDPLPTTVVLWTRVTPTPAAVPGSGLGPDVPLTWEIATDDGFTHLVAEGTATATVAEDHTVHIDPHGLQPATTYFYRFTVAGLSEASEASEASAIAGAVSPTGRTRTTPVADADVERLNLAVCSCANFESGYFSTYSDIAQRAEAGEVDVVIHLGDYIYEYASGVNPGKSGVSRPFAPSWEIVTAADYRVRYGHYRRDSELQAAHAAAPWVVTWDDHELANNAHADGAEGHDILEGSWEDRKKAAMGAYFDWMPVRATNPAEGGRLYRSLRFGTLAELHMLDLRSYRSNSGLVWQGGKQESPTMMGQEQFAWLSGKLATTNTTWSLIGTSVMLSELNLFGIESAVATQLAGLVGADAVSELGPNLNPDQWDGYPADRERLLNQIAESRPDGSTVFLTGDIHSEWAGRISRDEEVIAAELVCASITAANVDDALGLPVGNALSASAENHVLTHNPHFEHVNLDHHGYLMVTIDQAGVTAQWRRVDNVEVAGSPVHPGPTLRYSGGSFAAV